MTEKKPPPDWAAIERDYRAGVKSMRLIGKEYGVSNVAILKRAKKLGWERDLSERIRLKAQDKVSRAMVSTEVSKAKAANEARVVEVNAELQKNILLEHREHIQESRVIVRKLLQELGLQTDNREALEEFAEIAAEVQSGLRSAVNGERAEGLVTKDQERRFTQAYNTIINAVSLQTRAQIGQRLIDALKNVVALEREAFGIDDKTKPEDAMVKALKMLADGYQPAT